MAEPNTTIEFRRTVQVRPYETATASIQVSFDTDMEANEEFVAKVKSAFMEAKGLVFEQLGLEFHVENGVVLEVFREHFGPVTVERVDPKPSAGAIDPSTIAKPKNMSDSEFDAVLADIVSNPEGWYDNRRDKRNPKGPDFKRKSDGVALWLK